MAVASFYTAGRAQRHRGRAWTAVNLHFAEPRKQRARPPCYRHARAVVPVSKTRAPGRGRNRSWRARGWRAFRPMHKPPASCWKPPKQHAWAFQPRRAGRDLHPETRAAALRWPSNRALRHAAERVSWSLPTNCRSTDHRRDCRCAGHHELTPDTGKAFQAMSLCRLPRKPA